MSRLSAERDRLLDLYLGGYVDRDTFVGRKGKLDEEVARLEARTADEATAVRQGKELIALALKLSRNCHATYRRVSPETKRLWNQAFLDHVVITSKEPSKVVWAEPFRTLFGVQRRRVSDKRLLVVLSGRLSNQAFQNELRAIYQVIQPVEVFPVAQPL